MIPYGRQSISDEDVQAVIDVLKSDFLTQGPAVPAFEDAVACYAGSKYAVAVSSATSALHIACLALGVGPGQLVWTSPITFVATANCALYCGAEVDFVDIDAATYNMSVAALAAKLEQAELEGRLPSVVIPVHLAGQSCDMAAIAALSKRYGFRVIEDASHAVGATYCDGAVGDCRFSDIVVFSFHPVKIITTAEGGIALTNDAELAHRMSILRTHGITRDVKKMKNESHGPWYYEQTDLGFNYRMTDIQAALGVSQIHRLNDFVITRRALAKRYDEALSDVPLVRPWQHPDTLSSYHLYVIRLDLASSAVGHREAFDQLREKGVGVNLHYIPVYLQPYYEGLGFTAGLCPEAERYYSEAISIPLFAGLKPEEQDHVITSLIEVTGL